MRESRITPYSQEVNPSIGSEPAYFASNKGSVKGQPQAGAKATLVEQFSQILEKIAYQFSLNAGESAFGPINLEAAKPKPIAKERVVTEPAKQPQVPSANTTERTTGTPQAKPVTVTERGSSEGHREISKKENSEIRVDTKLKQEGVPNSEVEPQQADPTEPQLVDEQEVSMQQIAVAAAAAADVAQVEIDIEKPEIEGHQADPKEEDEKLDLEMFEDIAVEDSSSELLNNQKLKHVAAGEKDSQIESQQMVEVPLQQDLSVQKEPDQAIEADQPSELKVSTESRHVAMSLQEQDPEALDAKIETTNSANAAVLAALKERSRPSFQQSALLARSIAAQLGTDGATPGSSLLDAMLSRQVAGGSSAQPHGTNSVAAISATNSSKDSDSAQSRSEALRGARTLTRAVGLQVLERVEQALKEISRSKDGSTLSVRLEPGHLGHVRVDVTLRDGNLHARLLADSPVVSQLLRDKAQELQSMLRKLGIDVQEVSVSVSSNDSQEQAWAENGSFNADVSNQRAQQKGAYGLGRSSNSKSGELITPQRNVNTEILDHWVA